MRSLLLKYASLFGIVLFGSLVIAMLSPVLGQGITAWSSLNGATRMAAQESEFSVTLLKAVTDGLLQNATMAPEMTAAAAKDIPGFVAGNLTPEPTLLPTLAQAPLVTPF